MVWPQWTATKGRLLWHWISAVVGIYLFFFCWNVITWWITTTSVHQINHTTPSNHFFCSPPCCPSPYHQQPPSSGGLFAQLSNQALAEATDLAGNTATWWRTFWRPYVGKGAVWSTSWLTRTWWHAGQSSALSNFQYNDPCQKKGPIGNLAFRRAWKLWMSSILGVSSCLNRFTIGAGWRPEMTGRWMRWIDSVGLYFHRILLSELAMKSYEILRGYTLVNWTIPPWRVSLFVCPPRKPCTIWAVP